MFQCCLYTYFIFVFCVIIELSVSIESEVGTIEKEPSADIISEGKCDSNLTLCTCDDVRNSLMYSGDCCMSMSCLDSDKFIDIDIYKSAFLPARMLPGFNIAVMALRHPKVNVDENIFEEISSIEEFNVYQSNIQIIPDFRFVKDSIKVIAINESRFTALEGNHLQDLKSVKKLFFCKNSLQSIDPDVFKGTDNVEYLDLSYNLLTSIPLKLLDPMKKLYSFAAIHNNLLHVDKLFSVTNPNIIRLDFNNLTIGDRIMHFDDFMALRKVEYSVHHPDKLNVEFELVDLSHNLIKITPRYLCSTENDVVKVNYITICRIHHLRLAGNGLQNLTSLGYAKVLKLDISENKIQYLADNDFRSIENTTSLELQGNEIQRIDSGAFSPMESSLNYLDLSSNRITSINGSVRYLSRLEFLNLAYNSIQTFEKDDFIRVHELTELRLHHNQIKTVGLLKQFNQLRLLDISHNDIESIRPDDVPKNLRTMNLAGNPFKCDCYLQPFIDQLKVNDLLTTDSDVCLKSDLGNRQQAKSNCPDVCSCRCTEFDNVSFMFADCSSRNLSVLPQFFRDNLTQMKGNETSTSGEWLPFITHQNIYPSLNVEDRVLGISLENNNLKSRDLSQLPTNLTLLYLAYNKLRYLPESIFDNQPNLKQMSLSGNPWHCDCKALKFKKWLASRTKIVRDIDNIRCETSDNSEKNLTGKVLWKLSDLDLCPTTDWAFVLSVSLGILTFVTFCLAVKLVYTKYELNIKVFLYSHGYTFVKEEDIDYDKEFDAFISFSHNDDEFVIKEIINVIEDRVPNIRLCFSYRNFMPGEYIYDNITHAIQSSKKTVLVLSKEFLQSEWCLVEFKVAYTQTLKDKIHRIILIKYGDLPKEIDPAIDLYLKSTTYLIWGESNFWKKLLFILPANTSVRNPVPRHAAYNIVFDYNDL